MINESKLEIYTLQISPRSIDIKVFQITSADFIDSIFLYLVLGCPCQFFFLPSFIDIVSFPLLLSMLKKPLLSFLLSRENK